MLKSIDLKNKCGSCCNFKAIGGTTQGECLQNPYGEDVVHDPEHPYWIVQRSRIKCRLYNTRPQTNADRIRAMSDEELAVFMFSMVDCVSCQNKLMNNGKLVFGAGKKTCTDKDYYAMCDGDGRKCESVCLEWLRQPAKEDENE